MVQLKKAEFQYAEVEKAAITFTFANKVVLVYWSEVPLGILIDNNEIAHMNHSLFNTVWKQEVRFFTGKKNIINLFMMLLHDNPKEIISFGFSKVLGEIYTKDFASDWQEERVKMGIKLRSIVVDDPQSRVYYSDRARQHPFGVKFLNKKYQGPSGISIGKNIMVIFIYSPKLQQAILIKNKETTTVYKQYFETLWALARD